MKCVLLVALVIASAARLLPQVAPSAKVAPIIGGQLLSYEQAKQLILGKDEKIQDRDQMWERLPTALETYDCYVAANPRDPKRWVLLELIVGQAVESVGGNKERALALIPLSRVWFQQNEQANDSAQKLSLGARLADLANRALAADDIVYEQYRAIAGNSMHLAWNQGYLDEKAQWTSESWIARLDEFIRATDQRFARSDTYRFVAWAYFRSLRDAERVDDLLALYEKLIREGNQEEAKYWQSYLDGYYRETQSWGARPVELSLRVVDGTDVSLSAYRGKIVLLAYLASYELAEIRNIKAVYDKYRKHGFEVVGVALDTAEARQNVINTREAEGIRWPQYFDGLGTNGPIARALKVRKASGILLDREGKVVSRQACGDLLEKVVRTHLGLSTPDEKPAKGVSPRTLIEYGAEWGYLSSPIAPPNDWKTASTAIDWKRGLGPLGYGDGDEVTVIPFGIIPDRKYPCAYFKRKLEISDADAGQPFLIEMRVDDGAVVYVNGVEVGRFGMPQGPIAHDTMATADGSDDQEAIIYGPAGLLRSGSNLVAVSVHQRSRGSSDLSFDLQMTLREREGQNRTNQ